jgi:hypothetical protein
MAGNKEVRMNNIPDTVLLALLPEEIASTNEWWATLTSSAQQELVRLWDTRSDSCGFEYTLEPDGSHSWTPIQIDIGAMYQHPDKASTHHTWNRDLYEYIVSHPEVKVLAQFAERKFHICRSHSQARAAIETGVIPAEFACPFADEHCPMRALLAVAPGHSVIFFAKPDLRTVDNTNVSSNDRNA